MYKLKTSEKVFQTFNVLFLLLLVVIMLYPLWYVIVGSFSDNTSVVVSEGMLLWPKNFNINAYREVVNYKSIWTGYANSLFILSVGTVISMLLTAIAGYFLSRHGVMLQKYIAFLIIVTMYFSGGIIPFYFTVKNLGLNGSLWSLILPSAISTYNVIIMRTAFAAIPMSLEESAKIDGARHFTILFKIALPLCMPTIAVLILYYAVGYWNAWFNATLFLKERSKYPLQLILREIVLYNANAESSAGGNLDQEELGVTLQYATIVVATIPILCCYPFLQKYFEKGVMIGAVKG